MKHLTKENVLLVLVGLVVLSKANDMRTAPEAPEKPRRAAVERMRGMDRGDWGGRMRQMREHKKDSSAPKGKAQEISHKNKACCDSKKS